MLETSLILCQGQHRLVQVTPSLAVDGDGVGRGGGRMAVTVVTSQRAGQAGDGARVQPVGEAGKRVGIEG